MAGSAKKPATTAIIYDFDGTLAEGSIQEHSFLPELGIKPEEFWRDEVKPKAREHDADEILIYMWQMLKLAADRGASVTREALRKHGTATPLFPGVETWFDRVNSFGAERGLDIRHFVVSSGTYEMIEGCSIFPRFQQVFASRFVFEKQADGREVAVWPGLAINYTTKTQYLFRINKGIENSWDNERINRWMPMEERPIPFSRMIFIGDGDTDIPSMKMVRHQGGHSIAVFDRERWRQATIQEKVGRLIAEDRVHFVAPADYETGSQLDVTVRGILGRFAREAGYREGS